MTSSSAISNSVTAPLSSTSAQTAAQSGACEGDLQPLRNYHNFLCRYKLPKNARSQLLYQVHEDLLLLRGWTCVQVVQSEDALISYICGQAQPALDSVFPHAPPHVDRTQAVVPVCVSDRLTPQILHAFTTKCVHPCTKQPLRCVTMAIVDADSTTAYYRVFGTLEEIVHPQWKMKRANKGDGAGEQDDSADEEASEEEEEEEEHSEEQNDYGDDDDLEGDCEKDHV